MAERLTGFFWTPSDRASQPLAVAVPFSLAARLCTTPPARVVALVRARAAAAGIGPLVDVSSFDTGSYPGAPPVPVLPLLQLADGSRVSVVRALKRAVRRGCPAPGPRGAPRFPSVSLALGPDHGCARLSGAAVPYAYVWLMLRVLADGPGLAWALRYRAVTAVLSPRPPRVLLSPAMAVAAGVALVRIGYSLDQLAADYGSFSKACRLSAPGALATGASVVGTPSSWAGSGQAG